MLEIPDFKIPIQKIEYHGVSLFVKREDLIDAEISGNKYWKLFFNVNNYLKLNPANPLIVTFGGAYSNHIASVAALGKRLEIPTLGLIRGEELGVKWDQNPTLKRAAENGMRFKFLSRQAYREKETLTALWQSEFPHALIIPEGGTNELAVKGLQFMLTPETKDFFYLCAAVGTGGTLAGICKFAEPRQRPFGLMVVKDHSLRERVGRLGGRTDFNLIDAASGGYGRISDELVSFINGFKDRYGIPLDPVYTGKMMKRVFELVDEQYFDPRKKILIFHTGGLQGIAGANQLLKSKNRSTIIF